MEFNFVNLLSVVGAFTEKDFLVVATHEVSSNHRSWFTNDLKDLFVKGCLNDAVVELNYHHVHLSAS